jgi:DNA-binding MarR family transcriptional regulator
MPMNSDDPSLARTVALLVSLGPRLHRWAERETEITSGSGGLTWRQLEVLRSVTSLSEPSLGVVARDLGVTPAVVTGLADRLVRQAFLVRIPDVKDSRIIRVRITAAGLRALESTETQLCKRLAGPLIFLTTTELAILQAALQLLATRENRECSQCGAEAGSNDLYCANCGEKLPE